MYVILEGPERGGEMLIFVRNQGFRENMTGS